MEKAVILRFLLPDKTGEIYKTICIRKVRNRVRNHV